MAAAMAASAGGMIWHALLAYTCAWRGAEQTGGAHGTGMHRCAAGSCSRQLQPAVFFLSNHLVTVIGGRIVRGGDHDACRTALHSRGTVMAYVQTLYQPCLILAAGGPPRRTSALLTSCCTAAGTNGVGTSSLNSHARTPAAAQTAAAMAANSRLWCRPS